MSDSKITELLEVVSPDDNDVLVIVDSQEDPITTKKIKYKNLITFTPSFVNSILGNGQNTSSNNGTFTTLSFNNDIALLLNDNIDRPSPSRFRALVNGWYKLTFEMYATGAGNDDGSELRVIKNSVSTALAGSETKISRSRNNADQGGFTSKVFFVQLLANEYIEIQAAPLDGDVMNYQEHSGASFEFYKGL